MELHFACDSELISYVNLLTNVKVLTWLHILRVCDRLNCFYENKYRCSRPAEEPPKATEKKVKEKNSDDESEEKDDKEEKKEEEPEGNLPL